ncbi:MAG: DUF2764 family protein [Porphyromonas sp.]|nr:DUF2764 family protein [Porphyromonas sp.]
MAQYYTLGAALPALSLENQTAHLYTPEEFIHLLLPLLDKRDKRQLDLIRLERDNDLLARMLEERPLPEVSPELLALNREKLATLVKWMGEEAKLDPWMPVPYDREALDLKAYPKYMVDYVRHFLQLTPEERQKEGFAADHLADRYFTYLQDEGSHLIKLWSKLERSIAAIFAAIVVRDFDLDAKLYLIGESELLQLLRSGEWKELSYLKDADVVAEILQISEEQDLKKREMKIDALKWRLLDSFTFADFASINAMIAYYLRLVILNRWKKLDREQGAEAFREIINNLNEEGREELNEYRRMAEQSGALKRSSLGQKKQYI